MKADDVEAVKAGVRRTWAPALDLVVVGPERVSGLIAVDTVHVVLTNRRLYDVAHTGMAWMGHYLLRSASHTGRGLMRPVFSVDELWTPGHRSTASIGG